MPSADGPFARACHAVTGGNPFLLVTLLAQLAADGVEPDEQTATLLDTFGPEQVTRSVARLAAGAAELAHAAAVLGPATPLRRAASLAGLHIDAAARAADSLRSAGLLDSGRQLTLAHPLIAAALYAGLPSGERGLRHAAAARLLAAEGAAAERVGLHLLQTEPAGDPATVHTCERAQRCGAPTDVRTPACRYGVPSIKPSAAACGYSPGGPATSCTPPARARVATRSADPARSPRPSIAWPDSQRSGTATGPSPSASTSPNAVWRRT